MDKPKEYDTMADLPQWFLGFDCATKTFAFSLSRVDLPGFATARPALEGRLATLRAALAAAERDGATRAQCEALSAHIARALAEARSFVRIVDGETVDLCPGQRDADVGTVDRLRAVARYVAGRVRPSMRAADGRPIRVLIEYQLGANARARAVAAALVTLFADEDVFIIGPTLKNRVATCEAGRYCHFAARYASTYTANKAHAKFNFAQFEAAFGTEIPPQAAGLRGHIADSFLQVIGHLVHGKNDESARAMF